MKLVEIRNLRVLTQKDLADKSGVSEKAVYDIEAGRVARPRQSTIRKLAAALEVNPLDIEEFRATILGKESALASV